jgi:hypothetical protein
VCDHSRRATGHRQDRHVCRAGCPGQFGDGLCGHPHVVSGARVTADAADADQILEVGQNGRQDTVDGCA